MELTTEGKLILEARRLFAQGTIFGHSKLNTLEEFSKALDKEAPFQFLASIAEMDSGLTAMLIKLGNQTLRNSNTQNSAPSLRAAIARVGIKGCRAALITYHFDVMMREADEKWRGVFKSAIERSYRAASTSKTMATRLQQDCDIQLSIMLTVLYATSVFAKLVAAQSLGLKKNESTLTIIREPNSTLAELVLLSKNIPYDIISQVTEIDTEAPRSIESQIAKISWQKTLGNEIGGKQ